MMNLAINRPSRRRWTALILLLCTFSPAFVSAQNHLEGHGHDSSSAAELPGSTQDEFDGPGRSPQEDLTRQELEEAEFVFEDMLVEQARAQATLFALTAGAVVHGVGHWQLGNRQTTWSLLGLEAAGLSLITGGVVLALNPTGIASIDERRRDLWFLGIGVLSTSWLIDVFGTAYHDDLGIPRSTSRQTGWGAAMNYEYWRPRDLSLRHVATAQIFGKSRHLHLQARSSQELGFGMSDYEFTGRWFPFVGASSETRIGLMITARFLQYRLDDPFERGDTTASISASLNLGRLFAHLDQMSVGFDIGAGLRGYRFPGNTEHDWTSWNYGGWYLPLRLFLALNLTEGLRLQASFERWQGDWLERSRGRIGIPVIEFSYRSTEHLDLTFFTAFGDGVSLGAGLLLWFGE